MPASFILAFALMHTASFAPASTPELFELKPAGLSPPSKSRLRLAQSESELLLPPSEAVTQHRQRLVAAYTVLKYSTAASMVITGALGFVSTINKPTLFAEGLCARGTPFLGDYGCGPISKFHALAGVFSTALFSATSAIEFSLPDVQGVASIHGGAHDNKLHKVLRYTGLVVMLIQPFVGMISANPKAIGITGLKQQEKFSKVMRTTHGALGGISAFTVITKIVLEL